MATNKAIKFSVDSFKDYDFTKSSMAENREFLYRVVQELKPDRILELGTYYGCSYFAFAQAIKDEGLDTQLIGIDCWEGDIHTNFYDETVFKAFKKLNRKFWGKQANAHQQFSYIRNRFDAAVDMIEDNSVDVLLIDGTHTAEAVQQDFENYLPKLKQDGIVLFHDTNVQRFTLKEFWAIISKKYVSYNFKNKYGLGVLAPKGIGNYAKIKHLFDSPDVGIYSAIFGGKDSLKGQVFQTLPVTQFVYTDEFFDEDKGWLQIQTEKLYGDDDRMNAKVFKVRTPTGKLEIMDRQNPDYLIWIDGSIQIKNTRFVEHMVEVCGDSMLALIPHPDRNCVYQEYDACIEHGRLNDPEARQKAFGQLLRYKKEKYMPEQGLYCGTVFIRNMNHPRIEEFNELWWQEIERGSFRDQLSLPYVLWKMGEQPAIFDINLWSNEFFEYKKHLR